MKNSEIKKKPISEYVENINDTATHRALLWWTTLSMDEQVKKAYELIDEPSFNLTIRDITYLHTNQ